MSKENADTAARRFNTEQRVVLASMAALNLCGYACYSVIAPFFPHEVLRKGGTVTTVGLIFGCYQLVMLVLAPVFGQYVLVIGARFMLIAGPFIVGCCSILFGFLDMAQYGAAFISLAFIVRMFEAVGAIMFLTTSMSIRPALFPNDIAFVYGVLQVFTACGLAVGPALGGLLYEWGGYGVPFWALGATFIGLDIVLYFYLPIFSAAVPPAKPQSNSRVVHFWTFFLEIEILIDLLTYMVVAFAAMFYEATISIHIYPLVGSNSAYVGFVMLLVGVAECVAAPIGGLYQDRGGSPRKVMVFGYIVVIASLALMGPTPLLPFLHTSLLNVIIATILYGIGLGCFFAAPFKEAVEVIIRKGYPPTQHTFGNLAGCFQSCFSLGALLGPVIGAYLQDRFQFVWASTMVGCAVTVVFALLLFTHHIDIRSTAPDYIVIVRRK